MIRDAGIETADAITLMVGGITFATINDTLARFDVVIDDRSGRVHLETERFELLSELQLSGFGLRTRKADLHDGWLAIEHAFVAKARQGILDLAVPLPPGVSPRVVHAAVSCADVTFSSAPDLEDDAALTEGWLQFEPGTRTALARTPGGPPLVHLVPTSGTDVRVHVLARAQGYARVELEDSNTIVGWVAIEHAREVPGGREGGLFGFGRSGDGRRVARCPHDVRIYVHTGAKVHDVGRFKAGASFDYDGPSLDDPGVPAEIPVDLGSGELRPYVERADLAHCT